MHRAPLTGLLALLALAGSAHAAAEGPVWTYRVRPGDTLIALQARLLAPGIGWQALQQRNQVAEPRRLPIGRPLEIPVAWLRAQPVQADVLFVHGEVELRRAGEAPRPLASGEQVAAGDEIVTGARSSSAVLRLDDGSRLLVEPGSRLRVEALDRRGASAYRESRLKLENGGAEASVPPAPALPPRPRLQIRTPVVNLAVRGTEFRARSDEHGTRLEVLRGRVAAGARPVAAGRGLVATADGVQRARPLPTAPVLTLPAGPVTRLPLAFAWPPLAGATAYRAQVLDADADSRLRLDGRFDEAAAEWPDDLPDGRYELRVRAIGADGLEGLDARAGFELKARPEPPMPMEPAPAARVDAGRVAFAWTRHPQAAQYRLQVDTVASFESPQVDRELVDTATSVDLAPGRYFWRLRSVRPGGDAGPWGEALALEVVEPPPAPPAVPPQAEARHDRVTLAWPASPRPGVHYEIQVARDAGFAAPVLEGSSDRAAWSFEPPGAGLYHVRVRGVGSDGRPGAWGTAQQFEVPPAWHWWWLLPALLWLL
ncbi:FecR domain-containing protein [Rubrivivax sp. JA1024]|nr:FecR domain-containing protein [Rubrivivax sp. JA1024]